MNSATVPSSVFGSRRAAPATLGGALHRALVVLGWLLAVAGARADAPAWLLELAQQPRPAPAGDPPAVVLLEQTTVAVAETGATAVTRRVVLAIRNQSGAARAIGRVAYLEKRDVVKRTEAWLVRGTKTVRSLTARDWVDLSVANETELVSEGRHRVVDVTGLAAPGDVFAFETRVDGAMLFASAAWVFGWDLPVVRSRLQLQLPAGFGLERIFEGGPPPAETVSPDRRTWTWEVRDQPYLREEPASDPAAPEYAVLRYRLQPPAGATKFKPAVFTSWADATRWELQLQAGQCDTSPAIRATAEKLTAGLTDPLARLRALCEHAQGVRYIQVNREIARGYGFRPRKASEVAATGYGDCKDKSNLLISLVREAGFVAHAVGVLADDDGMPVNPAWPSPDQFDHQITAIEVPPEVDLPTVVARPDGRRLLFFDPTDDDTPLGGLPWSLQGGLGQLVTAGAEELVRLPRLDPAAQFATRSRATLRVEGDGRVHGRAVVECDGQAASIMRSFMHRLSEKELQNAIRRRLGETLRATELKSFARRDGRRDGRYGLELELSAPGFVQPLREKLALVRLDVFSRDSVPVFSEKTRRTPIRLHPLNQTDEVELGLPAGVEVDELPPPAKLETKYGAHERSFEVRGDTIVFRRRLVLHPLRVPVAEYAALRQFLADAAKADRAAVVLKR